MATRHLSRIIVLQSLYEWSFWNYPEDRWREIVQRNLGEFGQDVDEPDFVHRLMSRVVENRDFIDAKIKQYTPGWPFEQLPLVEKNILRLAVSELQFSDPQEVPPKVAINESVELTKNFCGENSARFVNGVLASVYKEIEGAQRKDEPVVNSN